MDLRESDYAIMISQLEQRIRACRTELVAIAERLADPAYPDSFRPSLREKRDLLISHRNRWERQLERAKRLAHRDYGMSS